MDRTQTPTVTSASKPVESAEPRYYTTFLFVATMLAGIIVGWVALLALVVRRY